MSFSACAAYPVVIDLCCLFNIAIQRLSYNRLHKENKKIDIRNLPSLSIAGAYGLLRHRKGRIQHGRTWPISSRLFTIVVRKAMNKLAKSLYWYRRQLFQTLFTYVPQVEGVVGGEIYKQRLISALGDSFGLRGKSFRWFPKIFQQFLKDTIVKLPHIMTNTICW